MRWLIILPVVLLLAGCEDGGRLFRGDLEPGPILPTPPQAVTSPVGAFAAQGTPLPLPAGGFGATLGPAGVALVPSDDDDDTPSELEDSDALICDPENDRVVLVKARDRTDEALPRTIDDFATLDEPRGVFALADRRALVATANGYALIDETGAVVGSEHVLSNGPYRALVFSDAGSIIFIAGSAGLERFNVDATTFEPIGTPALIHVSPDVQGVTMRANGDIVLTDGDALLRILSASTAGPGSATVVRTLAAGELALGVLVNSAGNAVVAVDATGAGGGGRLEEIVVETGEVAVDGSLTLSEAPRAVAISGRQAAFTWTSATGAFVQIEHPPSLADRLVPLFEVRGCTGCHNGSPGFTPTPMDLTSATDAHDTLVDVDTDCASGGPPPFRVAEGDLASSFFVEKLNPSPSCGDRMPVDLRPMPVVEIDSIRIWIEEGAPLSVPAHSQSHP